MDEINRVLCVSEYFYLSYFSFDGEFIRRKNIQRPYFWEYCIGPNIMAEVGRQFVPLSTPSMFALGVFDTANEDTLAIKYSIGDPTLLSTDKTAVKSWTWNYGTEGLLSRAAGNDTVWNLSKSGIQPAFLIKTDYPENIRKELLAANTGVEICYLKEQMPELQSLPAIQSITEDSNPLITLYHLK